MTTDTTMTDVDTGSAHIAALVAGMRERGMGLHADYIEALAAERDELERLAKAMAEGIEDAEPYFDATVMGLTRQGREITDHLRCSLAAFNVYQRKGE